MNTARPSLAEQFVYYTYYEPQIIWQYYVLTCPVIKTWWPSFAISRQSCCSFEKGISLHFCLLCQHLFMRRCHPVPPGNCIRNKLRVKYWPPKHKQEAVSAFSSKNWITLISRLDYSSLHTLDNHMCCIKWKHNVYRIILHWIYMDNYKRKKAIWKFLKVSAFHIDQLVSLVCIYSKCIGKFKNF